MSFLWQHTLILQIYWTYIEPSNKHQTTKIIIYCSFSANCTQFPHRKWGRASTHAPLSQINVHSLVTWQLNKLQNKKHMSLALETCNMAMAFKALIVPGSSSIDYNCNWCLWFALRTFPGPTFPTVSVTGCNCSPPHCVACSDVLQAESTDHTDFRENIMQFHWIGGIKKKA